jgi:hypothetical protein
MSGVLRFLRRELDHLLQGVANLHTDHAIHGYGPARAHAEDGTDQ